MKEILSTSIYLLLVLCAAYLIVTYVGQRTQVSGGSMESTLSNEDHLLVDKISYRFHDPERFDIIVFPFQYDKETYYIKRIIGMPGRPSGLTRMETFILMRSHWRRTMAERSSKIRAGRLSRLCWEMMNTLSWGITGITALTAETLRWEIFTGMTLSEEHLSGYGLYRNLAY